MTRYRFSGSAVLQCLECGEHECFTWQAGDEPILTPQHCETDMAQITHNDGETMLDEPCRSGCCPPS